MRVLKEHPLTLRRGGGDQLPGDDLLTLTHGHAVHANLLPLGQLLNELGGVRTGTEKANDRDVRGRLLPRRLHRQRHRLHESLTDGGGDVFLCRHHRAILAEALHNAHLLELIHAVLVIRHVRLFGRLEIVPLLPQGFVPGEGVEKIREARVLRQRHDVEPRLVWDPILGLLAHGLDVERAATLEEDVHQLGRERAGGYLNLIRQHKREDDLVPLEQTPLDVQVDAVRHEFDDVHDALRGHRRLLRVVDSELVQLVELLSDVCVRR